MGNSPHMPASMPIAEQRRVRGDAIRRVPGATASYEMPRFSWPGVMDALDESPEWRMGSAQTYDEVCVDFTTDDDVIEFDIKVNGSVIESIVCSTGLAQEFAISVVVVRDDKITLETTDFASGLAEDTAVTLRRSA